MGPKGDMRCRGVLSVIVNLPEMHIPPWYWFRRSHNSPQVGHDAGVSTSGSRAHSFHQGRGGGSTGGWWERCWPSSTTNGPRPAATLPFPTPTATMRYPPLISWKQRPDQRQRGRRAFTPIDGTLPTLRLLAAGVSRKSRCKPPGPLPYSNTGALPVS